MTSSYSLKKATEKSPFFVGCHKYIVDNHGFEQGFSEKLIFQKLNCNTFIPLLISN